ncbi:MAG: hypothetical protein ABI665_28320 [Vicinamibacterales bacterium]
MTRRRLLTIAAVVCPIAFSMGFPTVVRAQDSTPGVIAIIVNPSNPVDNLTRSELRRIFMMETQNWPHARKITVVLEEKGQPLRADVIRLICGISEAEYDRHILLQTFRGSIGWGPRAIRTVDAIMRFVFNAPGAIGYAPAAQANGTTKVLRIDGLRPIDPQYALRLPPPPAPGRRPGP